ncbi:hypothetical protein A6U88_14055 [Agrobacterium sp. B131/95]|uniref:Uncharacterized protein n=1 Tax=Rhizobium rhizogenes (strain K84 / ATCC BAA-868) TaxID=311403 RepID=B9JM31_RHIR8|nr:hypothetical protein Arad_7192 [Rhizobium rhizogenes K84]OCJ18989.1 hypothetical protein A6U88_14055 [Agrobacterium sp. B131/95]
MTLLGAVGPSYLIVRGNEPLDLGIFAQLDMELIESMRQFAFNKIPAWPSISSCMKPSRRSIFWFPDYMIAFAQLAPDRMRKY